MTQPRPTPWPSPRFRFLRSRPAIIWVGLTALCSLLLLSCILLPASRILPAVGRLLVVTDPLAPADAIVVLAGNGIERTAQAARLYRAGYAPWYVVTDMPLNVPGVRTDHAELMKTEAVWQGVPENVIVRAPGTHTTTYSEALAVRQMAEERGWRSLLVVSDPYHLRRARMCFRDALRGTGVTISVQPVDPSSYDPATWWTTQDGLRDTWTEYLKLLLYAIGYR